MAVIKKKLKQKCYCGKKGGCKLCNHTGVYSEDFYYMIDDKKKICFSADTLK